MSVVLKMVVKQRRFPVAFERAEDAGLTFLPDPDRFPAPVSPLLQTVFASAFEHGFADAARSLNLPLASAKVTFQNNYYFDALVPVIPKDQIEARLLAARAGDSLSREIPLLTERWEQTFLPRIEANLDRLATMRLSTVNPKALPFLIDEVIAITRDNWSMHFRLGMLTMAATLHFGELYANLFGGDQDARAQLTGLPSERVKADIGLSDLAAAAKAAGLDGLILSLPADRVLAALESAPNGPYYVAAVRDYLREYGLRQDRFDYTAPTWQEDPSVAIALIQSDLRSRHDARAEHAEAMKAAVKALNDARSRLAAFPNEVRERFEDAVAAARIASFLQDELTFALDQRGQALTRLLFLRLGQRLVDEGVLGKADDVFMLTLDDLKRVAAGPLTEEQIGATRMLVLEREAVLERSAELMPPPFIGAAPLGPLPLGDLVYRAVRYVTAGRRQELATTNDL